MNKVITGENQYCGPAVLSIITGKTVDECASLLAAHMGINEVKEVTYNSLLAILQKPRYRITVMNPDDASLYSNLLIISSIPGFYVVGVKKHVVAIEVTQDNQIFFCDNILRNQSTPAQVQD